MEILIDECVWGTAGSFDYIVGGMDQLPRGFLPGKFPSLFVMFVIRRDYVLSKYQAPKYEVQQNPFPFILNRI